MNSHINFKKLNTYMDGIIRYITGGNVVRGDQKLCKRSPYESVQI